MGGAAARWGWQLRLPGCTWRLARPALLALPAAQRSPAHPPLHAALPRRLHAQVLARVHDVILPALASPLRLADFLTATLGRGGLDGMLALNGIFLLVTRHGLEYPDFYRALYGLLTPGAFHVRVPSGAAGEPADVPRATPRAGWRRPPAGQP